jgi:hypothetical protein
MSLWLVKNKKIKTKKIQKIRKEIEREREREPKGGPTTGLGLPEPLLWPLGVVRPLQGPNL